MTSSGEPTTERPDRAPAPPPADLGIVAAMSIEVGPLLDRFRERRKYLVNRHTVYEGYLADRLAVLILTGMGSAAAERGTRLVIDGHRPRTILSIGFAGGLDPSLRRGHVGCPIEIVDGPSGRRIGCAPSIVEKTPESLPVSGRLVTVDRVVRLAAEKAALRERTGADLVDMESFAVAGLCAERGVRFASLRVVSDPAEVDLPPEILTLVGPTGGYRIGAAVGAICKRPSSLMDMLELRDHAYQAAERLASVIPGFIAQLA